MKVLLASDWYPPVVNGVVSSILTLRAQLVERGHEVRTLTLAPQARSTRDESGYHLASVGAGAIYEDARLGMPPSRRILEEVATWGPHVVHSQAEFATFIWSRRIVAATNAAHVHTYHTMYEDYTHYFSPSQRLGRAAAESFTRGVLARTDRVVAPTQKVADLLESYGVQTPVRVVPTGIDVHTLRPAQGDDRRTADRERLRARLGVGPQDPLLIYVGRLAKEKEFDRILRLLARYRAEHPSYARPDGVPAAGPRLLVVGDGPERTHLRQEAGRLGLDSVVTFVGAVPREEVGAWYVAGDLFVSSSRSETQGLTYAEALACGLPVLVAADPCLDELVGQGGGGWQFTTDDEFGVLLQAALEDRDRLARTAERARAVAVERCSAESFGARIEEVYDDALLHLPRHRAPRRRRLTSRTEPRLEIAAAPRVADLLGTGRRFG